MTTKKPATKCVKPWRGTTEDDTKYGKTVTEQMYHQWQDCTVYPDGCEPPLPPAVRKLIKAVRSWADSRIPLDILLHAWLAYLATAKRKKRS